VLELGALNFDVDGLGASRFELSLSLRNVNCGGEAAAIARLRKVESFLVGDDGGVEEFLLGVEATEGEIVES